jgi:hypothetical protein
MEKHHLCETTGIPDLDRANRTTDPDYTVGLDGFIPVKQIFNFLRVILFSSPHHQDLLLQKPISSDFHFSLVIVHEEPVLGSSCS